MFSGINHITLATRDIAESLQFYSDLGFEAHVRWDSGAYLSLNELWLCLSKGEVVANDDYTHLAFSISESHFEEFKAKLKRLGVIEWQRNSSEGKSVYFLDPSGHKLEVHVGDLASRLSELRENPYQGTQWLDD